MCFWNRTDIESVEEILGNFSISIVLRFGGGAEWMFTGVYGLVTTVNREEFWMELKKVKERWLGPWVVGGDFNVIWFIHENKGGRITRIMKEFEEFARFKDWQDVPLSNAWYT